MPHPLNANMQGEIQLQFAFVHQISTYVQTMKQTFFSQKSSLTKLSEFLKFTGNPVHRCSNFISSPTLRILFIQSQATGELLVN